MADIPDASSISPVAQAIATIVSGLGLGFLALMNFRRKPQLRETKDEVIIEGASIADMRPVREIAGYMQRIAEASEKMLAIMQDEATEERIERLAAIRAEQILKGRLP